MMSSRLQAAFALIAPILLAPQWFASEGSSKLQQIGPLWAHQLLSALVATGATATC
jgi:hypothetical protein